MIHTSYARRHKRDGYHSRAAEMFQAYGFSVRDQSAAGGGLPDLALGMCEITDLAELKVGNEPLTPAQEKFHKDWRGRPILIFRSFEACLEWAAKTAHERKRAALARAELPACIHRHREGTA